MRGDNRAGDLRKVQNGYYLTATVQRAVSVECLLDCLFSKFRGSQFRGKCSKFRCSQLRGKCKFGSLMSLLSAAYI